mmetsp:Transcript_59332/g.109696  ORF Transcript_59332/g.109696 Transcript_59332/m.109696 type:complete len:724 (-) Transcript_59332:30-2201(-)
MGGQVCCVQKRLEWSADCLGDGSAASSSSKGDIWHGLPPPMSSMSREEDYAAEVAWQIASDRRQQVFESSTLLQSLYDVKAPDHVDAYHIATAVDRKTEVSRQLATFQKPRGQTAQDRLHSFVAQLKRLSDQTEVVAKVFEVFEDHLNMHLLMERCTGGSLYERILERQYFTEQESAMLVKHMLESMLALHEQRLYHGNLTPASFGFLSASPAAPLKLLDFGLELKIHWWDAVEHVEGGLDPHNPQLPQFFETCKLVFCAPEFAPPSGSVKQRRRTIPLSFCSDLDREASKVSMKEDCDAILDTDLIADVIEEHADWFENQQQGLASDYHKKFEAADVWSIGAITFLLLCGYPPFFAPHRHAILGRIHRTEFAFDPPFWSKISEEGKDFVRACLQESCWARPSVREALEHPWIRMLAETSPVGPMLSPFMLNLRRFYRTSLIEVFTANTLACSLPREDVQEFLRRCKEIDQGNAGFFTASDLKHVLTAMHHGHVAEAITQKFLRTFRHPGESYIDYVALLDSVYLRQQRLFKDELWQHFLRVTKCSVAPHAGCAGFQPSERLLASDFGAFLKDSAVTELVSKLVPSSVVRQPVAVEGGLNDFLENTLQEHCKDLRTSSLDFHEMSTVLLKFGRVHGAAGSTATEAPPASVRRATAPATEVQADTPTPPEEAPTGQRGQQRRLAPEHIERPTAREAGPEARFSGPLPSNPAAVSRVPARPQPAG